LIHGCKCSCCRHILGRSLAAVSGHASVAVVADKAGNEQSSARQARTQQDRHNVWCCFVLRGL
jgi:hypothetical protein